MSGEALNWCKKLRVADATRKAILFVLADYADDAGSCYPSQETIASQACVSVRTVGNVLGEFQAQGAIRRQHRSKGKGHGRAPDRIFLNFNWQGVQPEPGATSTAFNMNEVPVAKANGQAKARVRIQPAPGSTCTPRPIQPAPGAEEPLGEPPEELLAPAKPPRKADPLFDALVAELGINPKELTQGARAAANTALRDLRHVGATPEQIHDRSAAYRRKFTTALTPTALAKQWPMLNSNGHSPPRAVKPDGFDARFDASE